MNTLREGYIRVALKQCLERSWDGGVDLRQLREWLQAASPDNRLSTILSCRRGDDTIIHRMVKESRDGSPVIACILKELSAADQLTLLNECNTQGYTAMHTAALLDRSAAAATILDSLPNDARGDVLKSLGERGETGLHCAASRGHMSTMEAILELVEQEERLQALKIQRGDGNTATHCAVLGNHKRVLLCMLRLLWMRQRYELLSVCNNDRQNTFDLATLTANIDIVRSVLDMVSQEHRYELLNKDKRRVLELERNVQDNIHLFEKFTHREVQYETELREVRERNRILTSLINNVIADRQRDDLGGTQAADDWLPMEETSV